MEQRFGYKTNFQIFGRRRNYLRTRKLSQKSKARSKRLETEVTSARARLNPLRRSFQFPKGKQIYEWYIMAPVVV